MWNVSTNALNKRLPIHDILKTEVKDELDEDGGSSTFEEDDPGAAELLLPETSDDSPTCPNQFQQVEEITRATPQEPQLTPQVTPGSKGTRNRVGLNKRSIRTAPKLSSSDQIRCFICYKKLIRSSSGPVSYPPTPFELEAGTPAEVSNSIQVVFLLRKLLEVPRTALETYLATAGSPARWIRSCSSCHGLLREAMRVNNRISKLLVQLSKCRRRIVAKIKETRREVGGTPDKCRVCDQVECAHYPVTDHIRQFVFSKTYADDSFVNQDENPKRAKTVTKIETSQKRNLKTGICPSEHDMTEAPDSLPEDDGLDPDDDQLQRNVPVALDRHEFEDSRSVNLIHSDDDDDDSEEYTPPPRRRKRERIDKSSKAKYESAEVQEADVCQSQKTKTSSKKLPQANDGKLEQNVETLESGNSTKYDTYLCGSCPNLEGMKLGAFISHVIFHYKRPQKCADCHVNLPDDDEAIERHWSKLHSDSTTFPKSYQVKMDIGKPWKCSKCTDVFSTDTEKSEHERVVHDILPGENSHACSQCPKSFKTLDEWRLHRGIEHPLYAAARCLFCDTYVSVKSNKGQDIPDYRMLSKHMRESHKDLKPKAYDVCNFCGETFLVNAHAHKFLNHVTTEHNVCPKRPYECTLCDANFQDKVNLAVHVKRVHYEGTYGCELCEFKAKSLPHLHRHKNSKHGIRDKDCVVYKCTHEGCTFENLNKKWLAMHLKKHLPTLPYVCRFCGKGFSFAQYLKRHEQTHSNPGIKPYICEICGNSFAQRNYLYIHTRLSHQRRPFGSKQRKPAGSSKTSSKT